MPPEPRFPNKQQSAKLSKFQANSSTPVTISPDSQSWDSHLPYSQLWLKIRERAEHKLKAKKRRW